jgi:hypothetical protein
MSDYSFVKIGTPVVVAADHAERTERGVVHEMVVGAYVLDAITAVRVGPEDDVAAGGGTTLRVPREALVLSIIPPKRKVVQFEAKLLIKMEMDIDASEQEVADTVRELLVESLETFDNVELTDGEADVEVSMLYFDDYKYSDPKCCDG